MHTAFEETPLARSAWTGQASGPLLLLPRPLLADWSGIDVPEYRAVDATFRWSDGEPRASDYDRACDVSEYAGVIAVGHGYGLVLSGGLRATTWVPRSWGGLLVRVERAASETAAEAVLQRLPKSVTPSGPVEFMITSSPLELFNSAEPGLEPLMPRLGIEIRAGAYEVRWMHYVPDAASAFGLIELRRAGT